MRFLCLILVFLLAARSNVRAEEPPPQGVPTDPKVIEKLIRDLGSDKFQTRQYASEALRVIGADARAALEKVEDSSDLEIRWRARELLALLRANVTSDWPQPLVEIVRGFRNLNAIEKNAAIANIHKNLGDKALPFLLSTIVYGESGEAGMAWNYLRVQNLPNINTLILDNVKQPKTGSAAKALAWALVRSERSVEALQTLSQFNITDTALTDCIEESAKRLLAQIRNNRFDVAEPAAAKFAEAAPSDPRFLYLRAAALDGLNKPDDAAKLREKALALNPEQETPHFNAGELLNSLGQDSAAEKEWLKILAMKPDDTVYDINARFRLTNILSRREQFSEAADQLQTALDLFRKARASGSSVNMSGANEKELETQVVALRAKAAQAGTPKVPVKTDDKKSDEHVGELTFSIGMQLKEGNIKTLREALRTVSGLLQINIQPLGVRLFDATEATLKYNAQKQEIVILVNDVPATQPSPMKIEEKQARIAVKTLDCWYVFQVDAVTGHAEKVARYEVDYTVKFQPTGKLATWTSVTVNLNGRPYDWEHLLKGVPFDYLPESFDLIIEGSTPSKERETLRLKIKPNEPPLGPENE